MNSIFKISKRTLTVLAGCVVGLIALSNTVHAQEKGLLYEIKGNGLESPSYLYGTIHIICESDLFLPDGMQEALDRSEQVVMELDMDDPSMPTKMQQVLMNKDMTNIGDLLSEEDKELVNAWFRENYGADLGQLGIIKPFGLVSMLYPKMYTCEKLGSYELTLVGEAQARSLEVLGLETIEFQMSVFDERPIDEQLGWLITLIKDQEETRASLSNMVDLYLDQDVEGLHDLVYEDGVMSNGAEWLLYKRNASWIDKMENLMRDKPTFFAVGAAHLGSSKGVIQLLRQSGYTVSRLK